MKKNQVAFYQAYIQDQKGQFCLEKINLLINQGEVICLTGLSNAGETVILQYLCGSARRIKGKIIINGQEMKRKYISEEKKKYFYLSSMEEIETKDLNLMEYLMLLSREKIGFKIWDEKENKKEAEKLLRSVGMNMEATVQCRDLSTVEKRILYLLRAVYSGTEIIMFHDEYEDLAGNDLNRYEKIIRRMKEKGFSFIIVTKNVRFAARFADVTCIFKDYHITKKFYRNRKSREEMSMFITSPVGMANNNNWKQKERYRADIVLPGMTERQTLFVNAGEILLVKVKDTGSLINLFLTLCGKNAGLEHIFLDGKRLRSVTLNNQYKNKIIFIRSFSDSGEVFENISAGENLMIPNVKKVHPFHFRRMETVEKAMERQLGNEKNLLMESGRLKVILERWKIFAPKLVILRMPFLNMDYDCRQEINHWMQDLTQEGTSFVIITSEIYDYKELYHRIWNFKDGERNES